MEIFVIKETDNSLDVDELVEKLKEKSGEENGSFTIVSGLPGHWRSVEDWAVFVCRANHKFERKLLMAEDDFTVVTKLLLQNSSRAITGDSDYLLSDQLHLQNILRKSRISDTEPECEDGVVAEAAKSYKKFLKSSGLVDRWEVVRSCAEFATREQLRLLVTRADPGQLELLQLLSGEVRPLQVAGGGVVVGDKCQMKDAVTEDSSPPQCVPDTVVLVASFLRLLLCSKEELSLARAVTSSGLLTDEQFSRVRHEAGASSLPMYQTIVSFVRQVSLGGRSYAPGDTNTLHELLPSLTQFNVVMEKLQTKLEETSGAEAAVTAVLGQLRSWLGKQGAAVSQDTADTLAALVREVAARQAGHQSTPARGRMGRPAVKLLAGLVDLLACVAVDTADCSQPGPGPGATPARQRQLVASFRTPGQQQQQQAASSLDPEDEVDRLLETKGLGERLQGGEAAPRTPVPRPGPAYPRFRTCNDFTEGSPALLRSADRDAAMATGGRTLMARGGGGSPVAADSSVESTRRILQEIQEKQEQESRQQVEEIKQNIKKSKRCLNKEVDQIVREKMGMKRKCDASESDSTNKKSSKKKKCATPKGQKKMTSFFAK